jgi:NAD(P)-dependent dehydrogenase (short-subunit alcohol dehydrogenase family)
VASNGGRLTKVQRDRHGRLDVVVNNATAVDASPQGRLPTHLKPTEGFDAVLNVGKLS